MTKSHFKPTYIFEFKNIKFVRWDTTNSNLKTLFFMLKFRFSEKATKIIKKSSSYLWQERCVLCAQQRTCQKVVEDFFLNVDKSYYTNFNTQYTAWTINFVQAVWLIFYNLTDNPQNTKS